MLKKYFNRKPRQVIRFTVTQQDLAEMKSIFTYDDLERNVITEQSNRFAGKLYELELPRHKAIHYHIHLDRNNSQRLAGNLHRAMN